MKDKTEPLVPGATYHVYNRAHGSERLFLSAENYRYFLKRYEYFISPVAQTFCYCLMPNHFHFLLRIKPEEEIKKRFETAESASPKFQTLEKLLSKQFSNLFSSYTQSFNKQQGRMGGLFMDTFKRKRADSMEYLYKLVHYIHYNPVQAKLCKMPDKWPHSSYHRIISGEEGFLNSNEIISWFDDADNFIQFHSQHPEINAIKI